MSWKTVCRASDIAPNELKLFDIDGIEIVVANVEGLFVAIPPLCPHMEDPLEASGICDKGVLTCTKHLWQWDLRTGEAMGLAEQPLRMYQVRTENGEIHVLMDKELVYDYDDDW